MIVPINYGRVCLLLEWVDWKVLVLGWGVSRCISCQRHTDFIFPVIGEELGLIATFTILVAFLIMFFTVGMKLRQISRMNDYLLAMGALLFIVLQAIINMGVVTGCLPTKGMSLPFISYGGSNLVVTFIFVGLVINVMRRKDNPSPIQAREL